MRLLLNLLLCLSLLGPMQARAVDVIIIRDPMAYPLKQYLFMVGVSVLGGLVSWYLKVRSGQIAAWNVMQLVGEMATSAFAGLLAFWMCMAAGVELAWTVPMVAIAGHMGARAIVLFENWAQRKFSLPETKE